MTKRHTDIEITRRIGANLRALRRTRGLSQADLGNAMGITFQQVQKYENGVNRLSASDAVTVAKILEIDLLRLFAGCADDITERPFQEIHEGDAELIAAARPLSVKVRKELAHLVTGIVDMRMTLDSGIGTHLGRHITTMESELVDGQQRDPVAMINDGPIMLDCTKEATA